MNSYDKLECKLVIITKNITVYSIGLTLFLLFFPIIIIYYYYQWFIRYDDSINKINEYSEKISKVEIEDSPYIQDKGNINGFHCIISYPKLKSPIIEFLDKHNILVFLRDYYKLQTRPHDVIVKYNNGKEIRYNIAHIGHPYHNGNMMQYKNNEIIIGFENSQHKPRITGVKDFQAYFYTRPKMSCGLVKHFLYESREMISSLVYYDFVFNLFRPLIDLICGTYKRHLQGMRNLYIQRIFTRYPDIKKFYDEKVLDKDYFKRNFIDLDWKPDKNGWKEIEDFSIALKNDYDE